jgi:AcrR family transcriptional regulator
VNAGPDRAEASQRRVAQAAVVAFAEKGFHGTTTRDIAAAAGLSSAGLYVHHRSKEDLLYVISKEGHGQTLALVRAAIRTHETPTAALQALMYDFALHHATWNTSSRVVNYELAALSPEHLEEVLEIRHSIDAEIRALLAHGVATKEFDIPDLITAAAALLSLGIDIGRWYRPGGRLSPGRVATSYAALGLRIVGAIDTAGATA